jgi:hypothetical protein
MMTLEELYSALEEADKRAQAGDEEAKQDAIELASMIEQFKESSEPTQQVDEVSPIIVGTATGVAAGAKGVSEVLPTAGNIARANKLINAPAASAIPDAPAATTPHGFHPGATSNAQFNAEQIEANKLLKPGNVPPGYKVEGNSRIIVPTTVDTQAKGTSPVIASKQEARKIALDKLKRGTTASGQFVGRVPGINVLGGGMAGYQGADAYNRAQRGDVPGAVISGTGSAGSAASTLLGKKHPIARIGGLGIGLVAPVINRAIDAQSAKEEKAAGGVVGYAAGGLSAVAQRLARAPKKSQKEIYEIAQRMAPQQLNEFVRAPGKTTSVAGKSLKQYQHEKNLKHDIVPGLQGQYSLDNLKPIDWETQRGGVSLILPGDASGVDTIRGIAGKKLANESVQEGGFPFALKFAQENPDVDPELWSSTGRAARGYFDLGKRVAQQYDTQNILPTYSKMPEGMEYALHFNDALRQGLKPNKADIRKLDKLMRQGQYKGHTFEDFKGFGDDEYVTEYMKKHPEFRKFFGARMQVQDFLKDVGLPPTYGIDTMHAVTRPELRNVETGAGGNLIGRLDLDRPNLTYSTHGTYENKTRDPGFNIPGEVVGRTKYITPYEMMYPDSLMAVRANPKQAPQEFGSLKFTGARQIIDNQHADEMAMYDEAMKKLTGRKEGGPIKGYAKGKIVSAAKKLILPPAENAARTQIIGTLPTYEKAGNILRQQGATGRGIDFGAGLGEGAKALGKDFDTYEPFAQNWKPTYSNAADVPSDEYGRLTNLNVLNVVPREVRDEIVQDIGRVMQPGGMGIITTRGKDVMNAKGLAGPEPMSVITSRDTYQKGFNKDELEEYLKYMLGDNFEIGRLNLGPAGALIKKKAGGGSISKDDITPEMWEWILKYGKDERLPIDDGMNQLGLGNRGVNKTRRPTTKIPFDPQSYNFGFEKDMSLHDIDEFKNQMGPLNGDYMTNLKAGGSSTPAWQRSEGKNPEGGLNAAGRASYNRETGGNLKAPQPEGGSRKKSFCARMSGMKKKLTSSETANDPDSRINKSLRKWKC